MNKITYAEIMQHNPCYNPVEIGMPIDYSANPIDFIQEYRHKVKELQDINWVIRKLLVLSLKQTKLYAIWCARQIKFLVKNKYSIEALNIAEAYTNGNTTLEELIKARYNLPSYAYYITKNITYIVTYDATNIVTATDEAYGIANEIASDADIFIKKNMENRQIDKLIEILEEKE
jgi:hypothetical protein